MADEGAVFILFRNLPENALRRSPPGGTVTIRFHDEGIDVLDQGPGILPEHLPSVLGRFRLALAHERTGRPLQAGGMRARHASSRLLGCGRMASASPASSARLRPESLAR